MVTENAADLAACFATKRSVMLAGRLVEIRALGIERMQQFAAFLLPAYENPVGFIALAASTELKTEPEIAARAVLLASIDVGGDTDRQEWLANISPPDRAELAVLIVEVNESGFQSALRLQSRVTDVLVRMSGGGPMQSSFSKSTDTIPANSLTPSPSVTSKPSIAPNGAASVN